MCNRYNEHLQNEPDETILRDAIVGIWIELNKEWQQLPKVLDWNSNEPIVVCEGLQETDNKCIFKHGFFKGSRWGNSFVIDQDKVIHLHAHLLIQILNSSLTELRARYAFVTSELLCDHILSTPELRKQFYDCMFCLYIRCACCHGLKKRFRK